MLRLVLATPVAFHEALQPFGAVAFKLSDVERVDGSLLSGWCSEPAWEDLR